MGIALLAGWVAGLSVAIFVGTAAMTVMETAIQRGLGVAAAGGAGIATGDALWGAAAAGAGAAIGRVLAPLAGVLQWTAVGGPGYDAREAAAFVVGVFLASLSWQWLLAAVGARRRRIFSDRTRRGVLAVDCVLLAVFIAYVALGLYRR